MVIEEVDLPRDEEVFTLADVESKYGIPTAQAFYLGSEGVLELCVLADERLRFWCVDEESIRIRSVGGVFPHSDDDRTFPREIQRKPSRPTRRISLLSLTEKACRGLIANPSGHVLEYKFPAGFVERKSRSGGRRKSVERVFPDRNPDDPLTEMVGDSGKWCFCAFGEDERFELDGPLENPMIFMVPVMANRIFVLGAGLRVHLEKLRLQPELATAYKGGQPTIKLSALSSAISVAAREGSTPVDAAVSLPASEPKSTEIVSVQPDGADDESTNATETAPEPASDPVTAMAALAEVEHPEVERAEVVPVLGSDPSLADVSPPMATVMPLFRRIRIAEMAEIYGFRNTKTVDARCTPGKSGYDPTYPAMHRDEKGKYWVSTEVEMHQHESIQRDLVVRKPKDA